MRVLRVMMCIVISMMLLACRSSSGWIISAPDGLGETVIVPAELQDSVEQMLSKPQVPLWPDEIRALSKDQRRAYAYFEFLRDPEGIESNKLLLIDVADPDLAMQDYLEELQQRIPLIESINVDHHFNSDATPTPMYFVYFSESITLGELLWLTDWILLNYSDVFVGAFPSRGIDLN